MLLNVFVDADNIPQPESLDECGLLEAAFLCGGIKRIVVSGNGCGKWAENWDAFLSRFHGIEVSKIHVKSRPQAADAVLIASLCELKNEGCAILLLTRDALLRATFERICELRGWKMLGRSPEEQPATRSANSAPTSPQHTESKEETAKAAVSAWVKKHPKAAVVPLNAIQSIAKHKKLNEAALARAAIEVLGGLDKKAQKMLETSLVG